MKFTFWCFAPALLLIVLGLVLDPPHQQSPAVKSHLAVRGKHPTVVQSSAPTGGQFLMGFGALMFIPATALVCIYWAGRAWRRASRDSDKGRIT